MSKVRHDRADDSSQLAVQSSCPQQQLYAVVEKVVQLKLAFPTWPPIAVLRMSSDGVSNCRSSSGHSGHGCCESVQTTSHRTFSYNKTFCHRHGKIAKIFSGMTNEQANEDRCQLCFFLGSREVRAMPASSHKLQMALVYQTTLNGDWHTVHPPCHSRFFLRIPMNTA